MKARLSPLERTIQTPVEISGLINKFVFTPVPKSDMNI